ncbi:hypothetical protein OHB12_04835 [Nocardia sp. NBC_01730]|uniref:hypothetical protein n=1 Tax=Nocardia sp. NBC_01730 TaxID=2975998 RepID=UPI002E11DF92|nr:hypothetical protein OHB12_04835 [Nocardia sp. NBC_01730]
MDDSTRRVFDARAEIAHLVPSPWNRDRFLAALRAWRGRPIQLMPVESSALTDVWLPGRGAPCGLWLDTETADVIAYAAGTTSFHVDQILWHEVGHMVLNHNAGAGDLAGLQVLLPHIDPATIRRVLGRSEFADGQEDEAEVFADLMLSSTSRWRASPPMTSLWGEQ